MKSKAIATRRSALRPLLLVMALVGLLGGQRCSCDNTRLELESVPIELVTSRAMDRANTEKHLAEIRAYFNKCRKGAPAFADVMLSWRSKGRFVASKASQGVGEVLRLVYATHPKAVLVLACKADLLEGTLARFCGWLSKGWAEIEQLAEKVPFVDLLAKLKAHLFGTESLKKVAGIVNSAGGAIYDKHKGLSNLHRSFFEQKFKTLVLDPAKLRATLRRVIFAYQKEVNENDRYVLAQLGKRTHTDDQQSVGRSAAELTKSFEAFLTQHDRPRGFNREIIESLIVTMMSTGATSVVSALFPTLNILNSLKVLRLATKSGDRSDKVVDLLSGLSVDGLARWLEKQHRNAKRVQMVAKVLDYLNRLERYIIDSKRGDGSVHPGMTTAKGLRQILREIGEERYKHRVEFYRKLK